MISKIDRRKFLQHSGLGTLAAMLSGSALATPPTALHAPGDRRVKTLQTPTPGGAAAFNRGRSQVNLNFLQGGGDYPFLNCMKTAQSWGLADNSGMPDPSTLDSDGYPTSITRGGVYTVFFVPSQANRPGNYVITWTGNGSISCNMANTPVSGSRTSTNGTGRYVFSTTETRFVIGIYAIGNPRISNLQVFHVNDEAALNAGEVFGAKFKQRLVEANFGVIRFLNWQSGNTTNVTTWATRKPASYVFYAGSEFRGTLYAGVTTSAGSAYSAAAPSTWPGLVDKATVIVKFNTSASGPCTLNVGGTGAVNILNQDCRALATDTYPIGGTWQSFATLVYDATLNAWIKQGGDRALGSTGIGNSAPPELMVRLCREVGAHPYFVTPPLAIDPATDYMPSLAAYCRDSGPAWMIPRFEGPNECWNYGWGFYGSSYAAAKASVYGWGSTAHNDWYGKAMSVLGQAVSAVYAGDRTRYQVLCGVQTMTGLDPVYGPPSSNERLASTKYLAQAAPAQASYSKTPASNWVTHVACAQYYNGSKYSTPQEATDAAAYAAAAGNPTLQMSIASAYAASSNSGSGSYTLSKCLTCYTNWKAWAKSFGVQAMCGYEGGYSPDYTGGGQSQIDLLKAASKQAAVLNGLTTLNYNNFVGMSGNGFVAEFPSCFQFSGHSPSGDCWSILEDIYQTPNPPQWNAIVTFNH